MNRLPRFPIGGIRRRSTAAAAALSVWLLFSGCAAFHPIHGVPARYLPEEYRGTSRAGKRTIDLSLLKQTPSATHRVDTGDVLGIYIEGVLGDRKLPQPVNIPLTNESPPSFGFPIPVRDDGTISLPLIGAINVRGLTVGEVEDRLKSAYLQQKQFLNPENNRILVSLQRARNYRVLVIRQEAQAAQPAAIGVFEVGSLKRGTGQVVSLPAYKNDVLHALAQTGGLPGLDAENAIYVIRRRKTSTGWTPIRNHSLPQAPTAVPAEAKRSAQERTVIRAQSSSWNPEISDHYSGPTVDPQANYRNGGARQFPVRTAPDPRANPHAQESGTGSSDYATYNRADVMNARVTQASSPQMPQSPQTQPQVDPRFAQPAQTTWGPPPGNPAFVSPPPATSETMAPPDDLPVMTPEEFGWDMTDAGLDGRRVIKIPIRLGAGETVDLQEQDIILEDGDIVFIESRDTEVFYTGGLLNSGQFTIPRDYDLNVLQAIAIAQARQMGSGGSRATQSVGGQSALNNDVSISASSLIILRYLPDGRMVPIEVDLYKARMDVAEQVIIQPGDYLLLQYRKPEAIAAFVERHLFEGALFGIAAAQLSQNRN